MTEQSLTLQNLITNFNNFITHYYVNNCTRTCNIRNFGTFINP